MFQDLSKFFVLKFVFHQYFRANNMTFALLHLVQGFFGVLLQGLKMSFILSLLKFFYTYTLYEFSSCKFIRLTHNEKTHCALVYEPNNYCFLFVGCRNIFEIKKKDS